MRARASGHGAAIEPFAWLALVVSLALGPGAAVAQPGTVLFEDNLNGNLNSWTVNSSGGTATITPDTAQQGRSLRLGGGAVSIESDPIPAAVPGARVDVWVRRGADSFSEDPDAGEDLVVSYLNSSNVWFPLTTLPGDGTPGDVFNLAFQLPSDALHGSLSIRFAVTDGDFANGDYWHVDNPTVTETALAVPPFGVGTCEDFEGGLGGWTVSTAGGDAGIGSQTFNSPGNSLFTRWGIVDATSHPLDLSGAGFVSLSLWVERGGGAGGSEQPEGGEDLVLEYRTSSGAWSTLDTFAGGGMAGEQLAPSYVLPSDAMHGAFSARLRQTGGSGSDFDYWHVDDVCLTAIQPLSWRLEEDVWNGTGGEVVETSGSGLDGTAVGGAQNDDATPAIDTDPGTCRYADLDAASDQYIEVPDDPALDFPNELTVAAWINARSLPSELYTIVSKDTNYEFHVDDQGRIYWWWQADNFRTNGFSITLNQWHHVAITFRSGSQTIYVDGVSRATNSYSGTLPQNDLPLFIGTDFNFVSRSFDGFIDEVNVIGRALSQAEVQSLMNETHDCPTPNAQFTINHDNYGIHCVAETITVDVVDADAGTPLNNYNALVTLDTQEGFGTWQLVSGGGVFDDGAAGDGLATYDWPLGESQAVFGLYYPEGPPQIDVDVYQDDNPGIRDTDAEGLLEFAANGFSLTAAPLGNPPGAVTPFATAQTAAIPFPVYLTAYGQTPDDPVCGVIETYTGDKGLELWFDYVDPATGTLVPSVDGNPLPAAEGSASPQTVTFSNGQAAVNVRYDDVGLLQLHVKDETTGNADLPNGIRGATANFVVRPADFELSNVVDSSGVPSDPTVDGPEDATFVRAGELFEMTVTAVDAEGDPTPNFGQESTPESVMLDQTVLAPSGGSNPPLAGGFGAFSSGSATGTDFAWNEVGVVELLPRVADGDYLGSGDVVASADRNVGRFYPDHFSVALNSPTVASACSADGFTYEGQTFGFVPGEEAVVTVTARSVSGGQTLNYTGGFFKLDETTVQNRTYASTSPEGTIDDTGLPMADPTVAETGPGQGTLTFSTGTGLVFARDATLPAPYAAGLTLSIDVIDGDGVVAAGAGIPPAGTVTFDGGGSGIAFDGDDEIRYGRVRLTNAVGSELVRLPVPSIVEHYAGAGTGFVQNADDSCTTGVGITLASFTENLDAGETCVLDSGAPGASGAGCPTAAPPAEQYQDPALAGDLNLRLEAPGAGNSGSVTVTADAPDWLEFDWDASVGGDEDPSATAVFGLYEGAPRRIYLRELYN